MKTDNMRNPYYILWVGTNDNSPPAANERTTGGVNVISASMLNTDSLYRLDKAPAWEKFNEFTKSRPQVPSPIQTLNSVSITGTANTYLARNPTTETGSNWNVVFGLSGTATFWGAEYVEQVVRTSFKSNRNPISWNRLTSNQQAWRTKNVLGKRGTIALKGAKKLGIVGTGVSTYLAFDNIRTGNANTIDYFDLGVGSAALGSAGVAFFIGSNPIGWAIGAGAGIYFTGRLVYDLLY